MNLRSLVHRLILRSLYNLMTLDNQENRYSPMILDILLYQENRYILLYQESLDILWALSNLLSLLSLDILMNPDNLWVLSNLVSRYNQENHYNLIDLLLQ
jgi:hypothetical protein